ncbi:hypothetical protein ACQP2U_13010 [Nocardia sp. CA-084685]|uniref:hypothetical protein n=1 Tax=Nocardia sp. CA-084685 TaxID=3239970 RepID=UPI003D9562C2
MIRTLIAVLLGAGLAGIVATGSAHAAPRNSLHEGMQVVGEDVQAGLYHTQGPRPGDYGFCFIKWLPYKGAKSSELIDIESYDGPSDVRLKAGDIITVDGCTWIFESA